MDPADQLDRVYEGVVHWADVISGRHTRFGWGGASSSVLQDGRADELHPEPGDGREPASTQEQGGRVHHHRRAGQCAGRGRDRCSTFFALRSAASSRSFPFIAHSRGMERGGHGAEQFQLRAEQPPSCGMVRPGARARAPWIWRRLMVEGRLAAPPLIRGGRKAHQLDSEPTG
jgi:hypothetical protein